MQRAAFSLLLAFALAAARPVAAADVTLLDLIETEYGYTTIADHYSGTRSTQLQLDGARSGIVAYLRGRGIADPQVPSLHAQRNGRGAVPAIERAIGLAIVRYGKRVEPRDLVYAAIRGQLAALHDPYSVLFTAREVAGFSRALDGAAFGGIGLALVRDGDAAPWRVERVIDGSPAARAGVREGDVLETIDGSPAAPLDDAAVTARLRGPAGSVVHVVLRRDGSALAPLALARAVVTPPDVNARLFGDVGYLALRGFPLDAADQLRSAQRRLAERGAVAFILDLRGNGGGYESAAVHVASLFIAAGPVVRIDARGKRSVIDADGKPLPPARWVVLVDGDSASGSELVAGALQDERKAVLVGARTFGKGSVQSMFPLPDGAAIKLTTAAYRTPSGRSVSGTGLRPDVVLAEPPNARRGDPAADPQLGAALNVLHDDTDGWRL